MVVTSYHRGGRQVSKKPDCTGGLCLQHKTLVFVDECAVLRIPISNYVAGFLFSVDVKLMYSGSVCVAMDQNISILLAH